MPKKIYFGVNSVARRVTKAYIGVGGVARKIKKAYIGIGGVARPFFSGNGVEYYGSITSLDASRKYMAAANVGSYVLFGGGQYGFATTTDYEQTVEAYNSALVHSACSNLSIARDKLAAASVGSYALFAGGDCDYSVQNKGYSYAVDAYNASLTKSTATDLSLGRQSLAGGSVGNYALFAGGNYYNWDSVKGVLADKVDAYNASLTRSAPTVLSVARSKLKGASIGNYVLFAGGENLSDDTSRVGYSTVDAYNASLTRSLPAALASTRTGYVAVHSSKYAIFAGGRTDPNASNVYTVDVYDASLTKHTVDNLTYSANSTKGTGACANDYLVVIGYSSYAEVYNDALVHEVVKCVAWDDYCTAGAVGNYVLVAGGCSTISGTCFGSSIVYAILTTPQGG